MLGIPARRKPGRGRPLNRAHDLARGLAVCVPCWEGGPIGGIPQLGLRAYELASGLSLQPTNNYAVFGSGPGGLGVALGTGGAAYSATIPASLQMRWPISLAMGFRSLGSRAAGSMLGGLAANNTWTSPWGVLVFNFPGATPNALSIAYNAAGSTPVAITNLAPLPEATDLVWGASFGPTAQAVYSQGRPVYSGTSALADPQYATSPTLFLGPHPSQTSSIANVLVYWLMMWNRMLSPAEHAQLAMDPWRVLVPSTDNAFMQLAPPTPGAGAFPVVGSAIIRHPAA